MFKKKGGFEPVTYRRRQRLATGMCISTLGHIRDVTNNHVLVHKTDQQQVDLATSRKKIYWYGRVGDYFGRYVWSLF